MFNLSLNETEIQLNNSGFMKKITDIIEKDENLRKEFYENIWRTLEADGKYVDECGWTEGEPDRLIVNIPIAVYYTYDRYQSPE